MKKHYFLIFFFLSTAFAFAQSIDEYNGNKEKVTKQVEIDGFRMYPNPVSDGNLYIATLHNRKKNVQIFDVLGKRIFSKTLLNNKTRLDVSKLGSGVYILKVSEDKYSVTRKLVIR